MNRSFREQKGNNIKICLELSSNYRIPEIEYGALFYGEKKCTYFIFIQNQRRRQQLTRSQQQMMSG